MSVLESMGDRLDDRGFAELGVNLFLSRMPDKPDNCLALFEYDGGPPMQTLGPNAVALDRVRIQVMGRGTRDKYPEIRNRMLAIRLDLGSITNEVLTGFRVLRSSAQGYPTLMGYDDNNRFRIVFNLELTVEPTPVLSGFGADPFGLSTFGG